MSTSTGSEYKSNIVQEQDSVEFYFKVNAYFKILDTVIINMEKRFSPESLKMAVSVDNFFKFNFEESKFFVDHYQVIIVLFEITLMITKMLCFPL